MQFLWTLRQSVLGVGSVIGTHNTFTQAIDGIRKVVKRGIAVGYVGESHTTFKPKWTGFKRLTLLEEYEDDESRLKLMVQQFREFFKKHGRRIVTVSQEYIFPQDIYAVGVNMQGKMAVPEKVRVTMELE